MHLYQLCEAEMIICGLLSGKILNEQCVQDQHSESVNCTASQTNKQTLPSSFSY